MVAVGSACMGSGDDELGKTLMKGFLFALTQLRPLPDTVISWTPREALPRAHMASAAACTTWGGRQRAVAALSR